MAELALELDFCKTAWPMRKGYRHFLDGRDTSGRSSYSKSVASKWLHRLESCEHATARMAHSVVHRHKHSQQKSDACRTKSKRYKSPREPESWMMSSGREALDWENFDHSFLEFHDSDDLSDWDSGSESTCSGISGSTCSSCSTSSNASSKSEKSELEPTRWEMAQRVAASTAAAYRKSEPKSWQIGLALCLSCMSSKVSILRVLSALASVSRFRGWCLPGPKPSSPRRKSRSRRGSSLPCLACKLQ